MDKNRPTSKKFNFPLNDSSSSSSSSGSESGDCKNTSCSESDYDSQDSKNKQFKNLKTPNKQTKSFISIRPVKVDPITRQINSSKYPLYSLLRKTQGHDIYIKNLTKRELHTIRNIFLSVHNLKNTKIVNGEYTLPKQTARAFKKCRNEIEAFYKTTKKADMQSALLSINQIDNFRSIRRILTANKILARMYRLILNKKNNKHGQ